ncbi:MAG: hypothetical protein K2W82_05435 [Candidatus Obscuribacterales bacterium]|nr:hypothetical protein [Candidatus Obscuribacterales bacterium]
MLMGSIRLWLVLVLLVKIPATVAAEPESSVLAAQKNFLQGGVQIQGEQGLPANHGFATYQKGWNALDRSDYTLASTLFKQAGDQMQAATGETQYLAEARFAEAQTRKLMGQYDQAGKLFLAAIQLFKRTDPTSDYLKAALDALAQMPAEKKKGLQGKVEDSGKLPSLKARPLPDVVEENIVLSSKITQLDTGTSITNLKDGAFFNRTRGMLPGSAAVDLSDDYVKKTIYKAFAKMNCMETTSVGANYFTANRNYKPIKANGKPVAIGASSDFLGPIAEIKINGRYYKVPMDLPGLSPNSRNVMLTTNGDTVVAIDPRTSESWKLCTSFSRKVPEFNWWKLGRAKPVRKS